MEQFKLQTIFYLFGFLLLLSDVCKAAKIKSVSAPQIYELKESNTDSLVLNCDFDVSPDETGFVLKWLHNGVAAYQWIPTMVSPVALGSHKGRFDLNYPVNEDKNKKFSSLVIKKPVLSDAGNYTCYVNSFKDNDKKTVEVKIVDPADSINIKINFNDNDTVKFECDVQGIAPRPEVSFIINNKEDSDVESIYEETEDGAMNVKIVSNKNKEELEDDSDVECIVKIPSANYSKKETVTYDDPKHTTTTKNTNAILGELTISKNPQSNTNSENGAAASQKSLHLIMSAGICLILSFLRQ